ncbi:MAG TPA: GNAT family N-acetyltransferase [Fimbriimonadaceae bacterium]|nr:GNAT family N-acetyltransferase [Fimbriimonadaceae bacterium]
MVETLTVRLADLGDSRDAEAVRTMTNTYARDPMARGDDLPAEVLDRLVEEMRAHPAMFVLLAWQGDEPVGIATCLYSFSTFRAQRLVNLHDFCVVPQMRGKGVSRAMLLALEEHARAQGCAGITLEVYGRNRHAREVYEAMGFAGAKADGDDATYFCFKEVK